ncbi:MAG TPA: ATPase, T2SS/T4P/T4SS family [Burkholderiaceae bacterium]|nr:ATPase, T2SS/T4P/T4SS family [Burkholderiaceae bacterium]
MSGEPPKPPPPPSGEPAKLPAFPLLGEALVAAGRVEPQIIEDALAEQERSRIRLGEILQSRGVVDGGEIERIVNAQRQQRRLPSVLQRFGLKPHQIQQTVRRIEQKEPLDQVMRDTGYLSEEGVANAMAVLSGLQYAGPSLVDQVDGERLRREGVEARPGQPFAPVGFAGDGSLLVALAARDAQPAAHNAYHVRHRLRYVFASRSTVQAIFCRYFARVDAQLRGAIELAERALHQMSSGEQVDDTINRRLLGTLLRFACFTAASDLRLYTTLYRATINARYDGVGRDITEISRPLLDALWTLLANDARVQPESMADRLVEGAISFRQDEVIRREFGDLFARYSFRLELGGSARGGRTATIRILDSQSAMTTLDAIGYEPGELALIRRALREPDGLVLLTGPTGSGKTTALYSMLETIDPEEKSIQTIENPVERRYGKWLQYEVGKGVDDTESDVFVDHFRQLLRNDPDVIMVGEIRSPAAARLTIQAAQTGHLVLSTLHVDRAHHVFSRFRGLGVEPAELAEHLSLVVAQRLVRRLCVHCAEPDGSTDTRQLLAPALNSWLSGHVAAPRAARPGGCPNCNHSGYRGRTVVYELVEADGHLRGLVESGAPASELERTLHRDGGSLWHSGLRLVARGITSVAALREAVREPR